MLVFETVLTPTPNLS